MELTRDGVEPEGAHGRPPSTMVVGFDVIDVIPLDPNCLRDCIEDLRSTGTEKRSGPVSPV